MTYVKVLPDPHWWHECKDQTRPLVEKSRFDDPCWRDDFPGDFPYPAPTKHFNRPKSGDNARKINPDWLAYVKAINHEAAFNALMVVDAVWINRASNQEYSTGYQIPYPPPNDPKVEGITSIENYHKVVERRNGSTRIEAFNYANTPPDPERFNPHTHPWLFSHLTSIDAEGNIGRAPQGYNAYIPILAVDGQAWLDDEKLEHGVELPKETNMLPEIGDYSRHNGDTDLNIAKQNGVQVAIIRAGISWGYQDAWYPANWQKAIDASMYRTSYHVIYTDQPIVKQADNWYKVHPERDILPRDIDLEVDMGDEPEAKAETVWDMSNLILVRDGVRPLIYSRYLLINEWLASWTNEMKNAHYYHLAQYLNDRTKEHPGPPTLPDGVLRERVLIHQTADKIPGYPGEVESAARDKNRWQLGDEAQMHQFIADNWGAGTPPPPVNEYNAGWNASKQDTINKAEASKL